MSSHIKIVKENFSKRSDIQGELRQIDEAATSDQRAYTEAEEARVTELRNNIEAIDGRIAANIDMEQRTQTMSTGIEGLLGALVDRETGVVTDARSLGEQFAESDGFRAWVDSGARGGSPAIDFHTELRAVTDVTSGATSGGGFGGTGRLGIVGQDFLDRKVFLADVLPSINVSTGSIEYVQDESPLADFLDKPAAVTEGDSKPQAGITTRVVTEAPATIAAWVNITRQIAADAPQVAAYLDQRLRYALKRQVDAAIINGNGTPPNLTGLLNRTGINTVSPAAAEEAYATIRAAITEMELAESVPEIIVLNPADAEKFDLSNASSAGLHAVPNVAGPGATTSWGMTQVRSTAIAAGTAMLIDPMAVAVLDRQQATAYMTDSHDANFTKNILTMLLEARVGLALFAPAGVCKVTFNYA